MEPAPTAQLLGQPILVMDESSPLLWDGVFCDQVERWVLYDDGHILFCDTLLTHQQAGTFRVAQMTKESLAEFLGRLPREQFRTEEPMSTGGGGTDGMLTSLLLRDGQGWKEVYVVGLSDQGGSLRNRMRGWLSELFGVQKAPPPAFAEILKAIRSVPLEASVPLTAPEPATLSNWKPKGVTG